MKKHLLITLLLITLFLTGCVNGTPTNQNTNETLSTNQNTTTTTNEVILTPTTTQESNNTPTTTETIDTSDWLTYRNEEYGFEFKYPRDWNIVNDDFADNIDLNNRGRFGIPGFWLLQFNTSIIKNDHNIPIYIFFDSCSRMGANCDYDLGSPLFNNNGLYIFKDKSGSGNMWNITKISIIDNGKIINDDLFSIAYTYDLNEGIGYNDYVGYEVRSYLDSLIFNVIKTIILIN